MADFPNRPRIEEFVAYLLEGRAGDLVIAHAIKDKLSTREINEVFRTAKARRASKG